ncbi:MAG: ECF transporter S component [Clostridia bacterium]|nr:ECF transporter S component [Clostridia bacterium]
MKKAISLYGVSLAKQLAFTAVFAALCCVGTLLITIPLPASGFFNTGDVFVLLSGWFLGPLYGAVAAAVGSALADVIAGWAIYAPATFVVKGVDALLAYTVCALLKKLIKKETLDFLPRALSAVVGEAFMVLGYFLFETVLYGFVGAAPNVVGNVLQGVCCLLLATVLVSALRPVKAVRQFFPLLAAEKK